MSPLLVGKRKGFQLFPKVLKQKIEADRGISPGVTGEGITARTQLPPHSLAGSVISPTIPQISLSTGCKKQQGSPVVSWLEGLLKGFSCHPFPDVPRRAGAAVPTHHGRQVGPSSGRSPADYRDLCSWVWRTGRSQQPRSAPHAAALPSPPRPLVNKEV